MRRLSGLAVTVLILAGACSGDDSASTTSSDGLTVSGLDTAQDNASGENILEQSFTEFNGEEATFGDFAGKPMVVNFWASWCAPCIKEMPDFETVQRELNGEVTFIGINVQDQVEDAQDMVAKTGVTYELGRDPKGSLLAWVGGVGMPTTAFVDADGNVVKVISKALDAGKLRSEIGAIR